MITILGIIFVVAGIASVTIGYIGSFFG